MRIPPDLHDRLAWHIRRLPRVLGEARAAASAEGAALTHRQFYYLDLIGGGEGALTAGELAARLGVTRPTVSAAVGSLEAAGYVEKVRSSADRRSFGLRLTAKGEAAVREHDEAYASILGIFESHLSAAERAALLRLFDKIAQALDGALPATRFASGKDGRP